MGHANGKPKKVCRVVSADLILWFISMGIWNFPGGFLPLGGREKLPRFHRGVRQLPGERNHS